MLMSWKYVLAVVVAFETEYWYWKGESNFKKEKNRNTNQLIDFLRSESILSAQNCNFSILAANPTINSKLLYKHVRWTSFFSFLGFSVEQTSIFGSQSWLFCLLIEITASLLINILQARSMVRLSRWFHYADYSGHKIRKSNPKIISFSLIIFRNLKPNQQILIQFFLN